jgi:AraC-like DNA-binding protein
MSAPAFEFHRAVPRPPLDAFVEAIWAVRGSSGYRRFVMLPNGALQLMINFGAPHRVLAAGGRAVDRDHRAVWVAGLQDLPLEIESPETSDLLAIRFRPGGAHAVLPLPLSAVTNDVVEADAVVGAAAAELRERLALAPDWPARLRVAEGWLLARLRPREADHRRIAAAVARLSLHEARVSVQETCDCLGLSNRHLIALFRSLVGLPPKTFARVLRFHTALTRLPSSSSRAALAIDLGYADQAHFGNDFRRFAGVAPGDFLRRRGADDESLIVG